MRGNTYSPYHSAAGTAVHLGEAPEAPPSTSPSIGDSRRGHARPVRPHCSVRTHGSWMAGDRRLVRRSKRHGGGNMGLSGPCLIVANQSTSRPAPGVRQTPLPCRWTSSWSASPWYSLGCGFSRFISHGSLNAPGAVPMFPCSGVVVKGDITFFRRIGRRIGILSHA